MEQAIHLYLQKTKAKEYIVSPCDTVVPQPPSYKHPETITFRKTADVCAGAVRELDIDYRELQKRFTSITTADTNMLKKFSNLKTLKINYVGLESLEGIPPLPLVMSFSCMGNSLTDLKGFPEFERLKELNLWGNQLVDLSQLPKLLHLETLDLTKNKFSGGLEVLAEKCPNLKTLSLGHNLLESISAIQPLKQLYNLESLMLYGNDVAQEISVKGYADRPLSLTSLVLKCGENGLPSRVQVFWKMDSKGVLHKGSQKGTVKSATSPGMNASNGSSGFFNPSESVIRSSFPSAGQSVMFPQKPIFEPTFHPHGKFFVPPCCQSKMSALHPQPFHQPIARFPLSSTSTPRQHFYGNLPYKVLEDVSRLGTFGRQ